MVSRASAKADRHQMSVYLVPDLLAAIDAERARIEAETGLKVGRCQIAARAMRAGIAVNGGL